MVPVLDNLPDEADAIKALARISQRPRRVSRGHFISVARLDTAMVNPRRVQGNCALLLALSSRFRE